MIIYKLTVDNKLHYKFSTLYRSIYANNQTAFRMKKIDLPLFVFDKVSNIVKPYKQYFLILQVQIAKHKAYFTTCSLDVQWVQKMYDLSKL